MYLDQPFKEFFSDVASEKPTPGGGSVTAVTGVQAVSLVLMVAKLTLGKKKYAHVQDEIKAIIDQCSAIKDSLMNQVEEDMIMFQGIMDVYKLPREERETSLKSPLTKSANFSFAMVEEGYEIVKQAARIAEIGNKNLISDAAIALLLGVNTIESAIINVRINLKPLNDVDLAEKLESKMKVIVDHAKQLKDKAFQIIGQEIQVG